MKPIVNTEVAIPKKLFDALCLYETWCAAMQKHNTSEDEVKQWITKKFDKALAEKFSSKFLFE